MKLLKSQKDEIFDLIENQGLSPTIFYFDEINDLNGNTVLKTKEWGFFFVFSEGSRGGHHSYFCPGRETYDETSYPGSWILQKSNIKNWIVYIKREINTPDKWDSLKNELDSMDIPEFKDNSKFTYQEYEIIEGKINYFKEKINKIDKLEGKVDVIDQKLDHLLDLAKSLNKRDWKDLFVGFFMNLIVQLSIDKETGKLLWEYIKSMFSSLIAIK